MLCLGPRGFLGVECIRVKDLHQGWLISSDGLNIRPPRAVQASGFLLSQPLCASLFCSTVPFSGLNSCIGVPAARLVENNSQRHVGLRYTMIRSICRNCNSLGPSLLSRLHFCGRLTIAAMKLFNYAPALTCFSPAPKSVGLGRCNFWGMSVYRYLQESYRTRVT